MVRAETGMTQSDGCEWLCVFVSVFSFLFTDSYVCVFVERLLIHNNPSLEAEVQFHFQDDTQATTYLLYPPAMTLTPDQKQVSKHCVLTLLLPLTETHMEILD